MTINCRGESEQNQMKLQEIIDERDGLLVRNASLSRQVRKILMRSKHRFSNKLNKL